MFVYFNSEVDGVMFSVTRLTDGIIIHNGFKLKINGKKELLEDSYLIINIDQDGEKYELNVDLPEIKYISKNN